MARKRFLSPDIWSDPFFLGLTSQERLLFIGMITLADDDGRLRASPAYLKGEIFPGDGLSDDQVAAMCDRLVRKNRNIRRYTHSKQTYITLITWPKYQAPSHPTPSRLPSPPRYKNDSATSGTSRENDPTDSADLHDLGMGVGRGLGSGLGSGLNTPYSPPKRGTSQRQKNKKPLSGKYRDRVIHG
jgi:hypothetical protein